MTRLGAVEAAAIGGLAVAGWVAVGPLGVALALVVGVAAAAVPTPYAFVVGQVLLVTLVPTDAAGFLGGQVALFGLLVGDLSDAGPVRRTVPPAVVALVVGLGVVFVAVPYGTLTAAAAVLTVAALALGVLSQYAVVGGR